MLERGSPRGGSEVDVYAFRANFSLAVQNMVLALFSVSCVR